LRHDAGDLLHGACCAVDIRAAQLGRQQVPAAEDVERKVAVAVIIAVEELAFLVAVQWIIRRVKVEDDLLWRLLVGFEENLDEQVFDRSRIVADFMVARRFGPTQLQPVQRRFAGQRCTVRSLRLQLARQHCQHRITAQVIVVVQVLIAQRDADDALHHHRLDLVLYQFRCARVGKAGGETLAQSDGPIGLAQQQRPGVRRDRATVERRHNSATLDGWKFKQCGITVCRHWGFLRIREKPWLQHDSLRIRAPMHMIR
jgi:hypothetical protein